MLDDEVFGRAYGLALPASIAGIAVGSVLAPALVSALGLTAALLACGTVVMAYCAVVWRTRPGAVPATTGRPTTGPATPEPAVAAPLVGAPTVVLPALYAPAGPVPGPRAFRATAARPTFPGSSAR
jgi:hypothetical protein